MRVIAGEKRHLILKTLDSLDIRPTTDKIKETLFNMIQFDIAGKNFLDLFAGSGAIGIEALSRGANKAVFVDNNIEAIKVIKENLAHTKLLDKAEVMRLDCKTAIGRLKGEKFSLVFLDPPYNTGLYIEVFEEIVKSDILTDDAKLILETSIAEDVNMICDMGFDITKEKKYKSNKHTFFRKKI